MLASQVIVHNTPRPLSVGLLTRGRKPFVENLRERDRVELDELAIGPGSVAELLCKGAVLGAVFPWRWAPAAVIAFHPITSTTLAVSMLATDDWRRVSLSAIRWASRFAIPSLLAAGYQRAECRTMAGHDDAIRLLDRFGFRAECTLPRYGRSGRDFIQYSWKASDHVSTVPT